MYHGVSMGCFGLRRLRVKRAMQLTAMSRGGVFFFFRSRNSGTFAWRKESCVINGEVWGMNSYLGGGLGKWSNLTNMFQMG